MSTENELGDNVLVLLLERRNAELKHTQESIRAITRTLVARKVLALEPAAVRLEIVPETFEEGVRAHSCAVFDPEGVLLRSFEGDSENPVDEAITGLLDDLTPEPGTDAWFRYVTFFERCSVDLLEAMNPDAGNEPWLRLVQLFGPPQPEAAAEARAA